MHLDNKNTNIGSAVDEEHEYQRPHEDEEVFAELLEITMERIFLANL